MLYYAGGSRPGVKNLLTRKLEKAKAPVYNYLFAWEYPINGGITAFHCSELAFCFHALSVPQIRTATGGGRWRWRCRTRSRRRGSTSRGRAIPASRGSSGSRTRRRTRRRWCSTPSASRSPLARRQAGVAAAASRCPGACRARRSRRCGDDRSLTLPPSHQRARSRACPFPFHGAGPAPTSRSLLPQGDPRCPRRHQP